MIDRDLETWEVFSTTARGGYSNPARLLFRNRYRPDEPARETLIDGDTTEAQRQVRTLSDDELRTLLEDAELVQ